MKAWIAAIVSALALLGCSNEFSKEFPLKEENPENSLLARWAEKEVLGSQRIEGIPWKVLRGPATTRRLDTVSRVQTTLLDIRHLEAERTEWGSFNGEQGGESCVALEFDEPQDWSQYNRIALWVYVHPSKNPNVHVALDLVNEGTSDGTLTPSRENDIVLPQGEWHQILWEIGYYPRERISRLEINQTLIGFDRETGEQYVTIDIGSLELQKVEPDHYTGWDVAPGKIAFSHIGYRPEDSKTALAREGGESFTIVDEKGNVVFEGKASKVSFRNIDYSVLDFSSLTKKGMYSIRYDEVQTRPFPIGEDVWMDPFFSALNFYYCQRCGYPVEGIHGVCHQDMQAFYEDEVKVVNGGWHDAGDLSQGYFRTGMSCYALLTALEVIKDPELRRRASDEVAWGIDWLLKCSFHDGRHVGFVKQRLYTDNVIGTVDDVIGKTEYVPWELFLGSSVFMKASFLKDSRYEPAAVENWEQAMRAREEWNEAEVLEAAWGATASTLLYNRFKEERYRQAAIQFGKLLLQCQEQSHVEGIPVAGYFYTNTSRRSLIHNFHTGFEEGPMIALRHLQEAFPEEGDWLGAASLYSKEYLQKGVASPFDMLPSGVYRRSDQTNPTSLVQYEAGVQLNENYAIRTFPIWVNHVFHGATNIHLSNTWALAEASLMLGDQKGMDLVREQLEWTFGRNPFSQSFMYGVGYDYAPLYTYCTTNVVGALPVGVDCFQNDEPYWNGSSHATAKEIWVEPVGRFIGALATYLEGM